VTVVGFDPTALAGVPVLVTGAGGFIGSHLCEALVGAGARVRAFVRYSGTGGRGWLDDGERAGAVEVVAGDVTDRDTVAAAVDGCRVVFHLAALIAIPYSYAAPLSYVRTNVEGTTTLLQAARAAGVARVVHTSTSETYGTARQVPMDETHPLQGQSPYAASKIGADKMAESFHRAFGLPVVTVRPFNTYGPRQSARAVIPTVITQCLARRPVRLGNLSPTRDFTFVGDTVRGFLAAAVAPEAAVGRTVNLGTGREIAIADLVALIGELTGHAPEVVSDSARVRPADSEVDRLLSDPSLAADLLGWRAEVDLRDGLARTIDWFAAHAGRYRTGDYVV